MNDVEREYLRQQSMEFATTANELAKVADAFEAVGMLGPHGKLQVLVAKFLANVGCLNYLINKPQDDL